MPVPQALNEGLKHAECELKDDGSCFYLCKYLSLDCAHCLEPLGKLLVSAPLPLSPLLDHALLDLSKVISHQPVSLNSVQAEQAECEEIITKAKSLETGVETDFMESFE